MVWQLGWLQLDQPGLEFSHQLLINLQLEELIRH